MNKKQFELTTGACHAIMLGMLDPETIVSAQEEQDDTSSGKSDTDKLFREANRPFNNMLQQL